MNHVFVDFENVPDVDLSLIGREGFTFTLLLGATQTKLKSTIVEKLLEHAAAVHLVRLTSGGKNAVDFALAYYLGGAAKADATGVFHIVSKDAGFEPLIEHLRSRHINVWRHDSFTSLVPPEPTKPPREDQFTRVETHLSKNVANRPKRRQALASHLLTFCGKESTDAEVKQLIERLENAGYLSIGDKGAVIYHDKINAA